MEIIMGCEAARISIGSGPAWIRTRLLAEPPSIIFVSRLRPETGDCAVDKTGEQAQARFRASVVAPLATRL
jgi:hypothetical protein